ncbi:MAG: hypothetical protein HYY03_04550 [Chloroflexi bacterium]|nr:hypothetical protein [Chloroflexota bacterium]
MNIEQLKKKHQGEWLAIVVERDAVAEPREGQLIYHSRDREVVWGKISEDKRRIYVTFAGPLIEEGKGIAFHGA